MESVLPRKVTCPFVQKKSTGVLNLWCALSCIYALLSACGGMLVLEQAHPLTCCFHLPAWGSAFPHAALVFDERMGSVQQIHTKHLTKPSKDVIITGAHVRIWPHQQVVTLTFTQCCSPHWSDVPRHSLLARDGWFAAESSTVDGNAHIA